MSHTAKYSLSTTTIKVSNSDGSLNFGQRFGRTGSPSGETVYSDGNGPFMSNQTFKQEFSLAAGATLMVDLKGRTGQTDVLNTTLNMDTVRALYVELDTPGTGPGNGIQIGPNGNACIATLGFGGGVSNMIVPDKLLLTQPNANWTVSTGAGNLSFKNTGAGTMTGTIIIDGTKPS